MMTTETTNTFSAAQQPAGAIKTGTRNCRICGEELTDGASINHGIGPVCRKKANKALALDIRTNIGKVDFFAFLNIGFNIPAAAQATWDKVQAVILKINEDQTGLDLRETVKQIAWILSFPELDRLTVEGLFNLVEACGYDAFANLLRLEGANGSGDSLLSFDAEKGLVVLRAPRNRDGRLAIKEISRNVRFTGEPLNNWTIPANEAEAFVKAVRRYWPLVSGAKQTLEAAAAYVAAAKPAAVVVATPKAKPVVCTERGFEIDIKSPFNAEFVADLKKLPFRDRGFVNGVWVVRANHREVVRGLLAKYYPAPAFEVSGLYPAPANV